MTTLIIARHGNTFTPEQIPTRVGKRTDFPLVDSGRKQAEKLGNYLLEHKLVPDLVYTSKLQRTQETAKIALQATGVSRHVVALDIFDEIDYGEDENQPEDKVIARIGAQAIKDWDEHAIVPQGWVTSPDEIINNWTNFAENLKYSGKIVLVLTSNGIARFAPLLAGTMAEFKEKHPLKLSTGALGILRFNGQKWHIEGWNIRPQ